MLPSFITPARLTAAVGVLTGLGAAVTAALGVVPHDGQVYLVGQEVAGLLTTGVSVAKFLEGQAGWEQQQAALRHDRLTQLQAQQHAAEQAALDRQHEAVMALTPEDALPQAAPSAAELPDEVPLNTVDKAGVIVDAVNPDNGEPLRLASQSA